MSEFTYNLTSVTKVEVEPWKFLLIFYNSLDSGFSLDPLVSQLTYRNFYKVEGGQLEKTYSYLGFYIFVGSSQLVLCMVQDLSASYRSLRALKPKQTKDIDGNGFITF